MGKFQDSNLAHKWLDGLDGIEIGGSAHNPFNLRGSTRDGSHLVGRCRNVDRYPGTDTVFKRAEIEMCGEAMAVDIVAPGDRLPLSDESVDYVISSHVIEHFYDPIGALLEWARVVRPGGVIFVIAPKRDALPDDRIRPVTRIEELIERHSSPRPAEADEDRHWTVWSAGLLRSVAAQLTGWRVAALLLSDDKVHNGHCLVLEKRGGPSLWPGLEPVDAPTMDGGLSYPTIPGWFDFPDIYSEQVTRAVDGDTFIEVGTYLGCSTEYMAKAIRASGKRILFTSCDVYVEDHYNAGDYIGQEHASLAAARHNLGPLANRYVRLEQVGSVELAARCADKSIAFVFLDGDHRTPALCADIAAWLPKIKPGGFIGGHDYTTYPDHVGVVVDEVFGDRVQGIGNSWLVEVTA